MSRRALLLRTLVFPAVRLTAHVETIPPPAVGEGLFDRALKLLRLPADLLQLRKELVEFLDADVSRYAVRRRSLGGMRFRMFSRRSPIRLSPWSFGLIGHSCWQAEHCHPRCTCEPLIVCPRRILSVAQLGQRRGMRNANRSAMAVESKPTPVAAGKAIRKNPYGSTLWVGGTGTHSPQPS